MTINKLHALLGKLIENGRGRLSVCVNKESFIDNRESDGVIILPIAGAILRYIGQADDDGGTKILADGTESMRNTLVIYGCSAEPKTGLVAYEPATAPAI